MALSVSDSTISANTAQGASGGSMGDPGGLGQGGGIVSLGMGTISGCSIVGNVASGGVANTGQSPQDHVSGNGEGGGVYNSGDLTITDSTVSGNQASGGAGAATGNSDYQQIAGTSGDGLGAGVFSSAAMTVENSTVTANIASGGVGPDNTIGGDFPNGGNGGNGEGAGIYCVALLTLTDSTIIQNTATAGAGGQGFPYIQDVGPNGTPGVAQGGGIFAAKNSVLYNSILSANNAISGADVYSPLSAASAYDLIGYGGGLTNGVNGIQMGIHDPMLSALGSYGGSTQTMVPLPGSPVIQAGSNALIPAGLSTDQRGTGYPRIFNTTVNIGAVEYQSAQSVSASPVITYTSPASQSATVGQSKPFTIGSFAESNATGPFIATIDWGDGSASTVAGGLTVGAIPAESHAYTAAGSETVSIYVSDASGNRSAAETFTVVSSAPAVSTTTPVSVSATTLTASTNLAATGSLVVFTAVVIGHSGAVPSGAVTFSTNGASLGTAQLVNGTATFTTSALVRGVNNVSAGYAGDTHYLTATLQAVAVNLYTPSKFIPILLTTPALPAVIVEGQPIKAAIALLLTNTGTTGKGVFTIKWFLNRSADLNGSQTLIATTPRRIALATGRQARVAQAIRSLPGTLVAGSYYLIAQMTDPDGNVNVVASPSTIALEAAFVSLAALVTQVTPVTITAGRSGSIVVTLTNRGNITATGPATLTINASVDGVTTPLALATLHLKMSIRAGKSKVMRVRLKVPAAIAAGTYLPMLAGSFAGQTLSAAGVVPFFVVG